MYCGNCGQEVEPGSTFCGNCGQPVNEINGEGQQNFEQQPTGTEVYRQPKKPKKQRDGSPALYIIVIVLGIALAILIGLAAAWIVYHPDEEQDRGATQATVSPQATEAVSASPSPSLTAEATISPTPQVITPSPAAVRTMTPPPVVQPNAGQSGGYRQGASAVKNPSYRTYRDVDFSFSCNYPAHFIVYNDNDNTHRYTVAAEDGSAALIIGAVQGTTTGEEGISSFQQNYGGYIDYQTKGNDYYAVSLISGNECHYKYCKQSGGKQRWFEFHSSAEYSDTYSQYIDAIYKSMNFFG